MTKKQRSLKMNNQPEVYELEHNSETGCQPTHILISEPDDLREWARYMADKIPAGCISVCSVDHRVPVDFLVEDPVDEILMAMEDMEDEPTVYATGIDVYSDVFTMEFRVKHTQYVLTLTLSIDPDDTTVPTRRAREYMIKRLGGSCKQTDRKCYTVVYVWRSDQTVTVETVKTRDGINGAVDEVILELLKSGYSVTAMPVDILAVFEGTHSAAIMPGAYTGKFKGTMDNADAW